MKKKKKNSLSAGVKVGLKVILAIVIILETDMEIEDRSQKYRKYVEENIF